MTVDKAARPARRFEDITSFSEAPATATPAQRTPVAIGRPTRRAVLRGLGVAGMALAMQTVGMLPLKKAWAANRYGYRLVNYPNGQCADFNCVPGCGPSKVCSSDPRGDYDGNVDTPSWQPYGHCCKRLVDKRGISPNGFWHRNSNAYNKVTGDDRKYQLRPGRCYGGDAWIWRVTGCPTEYGGCGTNTKTTMRCHDGWYKLAGADYPAGSEGGWIRTICKHRYGCG